MLISELEGIKHETSKNLPARLFQKQNKSLKLGRINADISHKLEKQLRSKTVKRFGSKKDNLPKAIQEAVKT